MVMVAAGVSLSSHTMKVSPASMLRQVGLDEGDAGQRAPQSGEQVAKVLADCHPYTSGPPDGRPIA